MHKKCLQPSVFSSMAGPYLQAAAVASEETRRMTVFLAAGKT